MDLSEEFTIGELVELEEAAGVPIEEIGEQMQSGKSSMRNILAMHYIIRRRKNPEWTIADSRALNINACIDELEELDRGKAPNRAARRRKRPARSKRTNAYSRQNADSHSKKPRN